MDNGNNNDNKVVINTNVQKVVVKTPPQEPKMIHSVSMNDHFKENIQYYVPINYKKKILTIIGIIVIIGISFYLIILLFSKINADYDAKYNTTTTMEYKDVFIETTTTTLPHYEVYTEEKTTMQQYQDVTEKVN